MFGGIIEGFLILPRAIVDETTNHNSALLINLVVDSSFCVLNVCSVLHRGLNVVECILVQH